MSAAVTIQAREGVVVEFPALSAAHRKRIKRLNDELAKLSRWNAFAEAYRTACHTVAHGERTRLRLDLAAEYGLEGYEADRALYGRSR